MALFSSKTSSEDSLVHFLSSSVSSGEAGFGTHRNRIERWLPEAGGAGNREMLVKGTDFRLYYGSVLGT